MSRRVAPAVLLAALLAVTIPVQARPAADIRSRPFSFTAISVPDSNFSEPSVALTQHDSVLFCGPTRPTVAYVRTGDWTTFQRQQLGSAGGSDCDVKVGADNAVYVADLQIAGTDIVKSVDDGVSFAFAGEEPVEEDRQWIAPDPSDPNVLYLAFHDLALENEVVAKSVDGGQSFTQHAIASSDPSLASDTVPNTFSGPVRVDPTDTSRVYVAYGTSTLDGNLTMCETQPTNCPFGLPRRVVVAASDDGGATFTDVVAIDSSAGSVIGNLFPWITVDRAGNVYVAAAGSVLNADGSVTNAMFVASSTDHGATWAAPTKINRGNGAVVFPTIVAGNDGIVDAAWLESSNPDQTQAGDWTVHFAQSRNAHDAAPAYTGVAGPVVRQGIICTLGINCSGNREMGDFMEIALDSFGYAHIAAPSTEDSPDHSSSTNQKVVWWRQDAGPSATSAPCRKAKQPDCVTTRPHP